MKYVNLIAVLLTIPTAIFGQTTAFPDAAFAKEIDRYLEESVRTINVDEAYLNKDIYVFLDVREKAEYETSHICHALHIGYDNPEWSVIEKLDKEIPIAVYCSIGYRSEKMGEKLKSRGFTKVVNIYGSIFEWVNRGYPVVTQGEKETLRVHTYNKKWSKWIRNDRVEVVW